MKCFPNWSRDSMHLSKNLSRPFSVGCVCVCVCVLYLQHDEVLRPGIEPTPQAFFSVCVCVCVCVCAVPAAWRSPPARDWAHTTTVCWQGQILNPLSCQGISYDLLFCSTLRLKDSSTIICVAVDHSRFTAIVRNMPQLIQTFSFNGQEHFALLSNADTNMLIHLSWYTYAGVSQGYINLGSKLSGLQFDFSKVVKQIHTSIRCV